MNFDGRKVAYFLLPSEPGPDNTFRVCVVTENEPGLSLMGDETRGQYPWFWDQQTCTRENRRLGNTPQETAELIASSIAQKRKVE